MQCEEGRQRGTRRLAAATAARFPLGGGAASGPRGLGNALKRTLRLASPIRPAAISWGHGRLDIVVRGLASTFWHKCWDGQQWLPDKPSWLPLLGKSHNRAVLASWGPGRLDVFVRGLDTGVYTKSLNELIWSAPV
jgi:hypothetical protein